MKNLIPLDHDTQFYADKVAEKFKLKTVHCPVCLSAFTQKKHWQKFCSKKCRHIAWNARHPRA